MKYNMTDIINQFFILPFLRGKNDGYIYKKGQLGDLFLRT